MADIAKTISVVNQMTADGIIENYALGGATAVIFYTEPIATEDVDVFVHLKPGGNPLMEFQPIFDYLKDKGYEMKGEHFYVEGFPVQFLPTGTELLNEAIDEANEFQLTNEVVVRVMTPEHLVAIMLNTGRLKDFLRIGVFIQHEVVNSELLQSILTEHNLAQKWKDNISKFQS
ncbi:MAG TPA: hypothetical protein PKE69_04280 [Pyrinomonadaceae bacterium]|nr:hypothetical protein [Pyrinomonadaceae bacterium]